MNRGDRAQEGKRWDRRLIGAIGLLYAVGLAGHLIPATRPLMLTITPGFLALLGLVVAVAGLRKEGARGIAWAVGAFGLTFALEAVGVATGAVFGPYGYGNVLGPMVLDVPLVIGFNWVLVVLGADDFARLLGIGRGVGKRSADPDDLCPLCVAAASGVLCVIVDLPLERVAVKLGYWEWYTPVVPIQNYLVWFATGAVAALALETLGHRVRSRLPAAYVLIQLVFFSVLSAVL